jgi:hypothetical protein
MQRAVSDVQRLREIAFEKWDVVRAVSGTDAHFGQLDGYLVEAVNLLRAGARNDDIADYLINVATEVLGVDTGSGMRARALVFARSIRDFAETAAPNAANRATFTDRR